MGGFETVPYELATAANVAEESAESLGRRLAAVRGEVEDLLGGRWRGAAADGFARGWDSWASAASDTVDRLQQIARLLAATGRAYREAEAASVLTP